MINVTNKPEVILKDRLERIQRFVQDAVDSFLVGGEFTSEKLKITFMANGTFAIEKHLYEWKASIYGCASIKDELSEFLLEFRDAYRSEGFTLYVDKWYEKSDELFRLTVHPV